MPRCPWDVAITIIFDIAWPDGVYDCVDTEKCDNRHDNLNPGVDHDDKEACNCNNNALILFRLREKNAIKFSFLRSRIGAAKFSFFQISLLATHSIDAIETLDSIVLLNTCSYVVTIRTVCFFDFPQMVCNYSK